MTNIILQSKSNPEHSANIADSCWGEIEATIIVRGRRSYGKEFKSKEDAVKWAETHLEMSALIERNFRAAQNGDRPSL
jgi:hypothetical protein